MNASSYIALALAAGIGIPVMARLNASLGLAIASTGWAALLLFFVALCGVALTLAATREPMPSNWLGATPASYGAGLLVAFYLLAVTFLIPRLGVGPTILTVVTGQILAAAAIDHFGWLGGVPRPLGNLRVAGLAAMFAGLVLFMRPDAP